MSGKMVFAVAAAFLAASLSGVEALHMKLNGAKEIPESVGRCAFEKFASFEEYRRVARKELVKLLALEDMEERKSPNRLKPETLWTRDFGWGKVEKLRFEYEPGEFGCAYFCVPAGAKPPYRVMICLQGHSSGMHTSIAVKWEDEKTPIPVKGDRALAVLWAKRGFASLCIEQRGMGERSYVKAKGRINCPLVMYQSLLIGRVLLGDRVLDIDCAIDYLKTRSDVDKDFLGITGNSGGGTAAMFAGALLPRLTHVMPSCAFCSFRGSIGSRRHCACNYVPDLLFFGEAADVLGLAAPRKVVVINGVKDPGFPIGDSKREFERLKKIYSAAGAPGNVIHAVGKEGHRYYMKEAFEAFEKLQ